jgi:hypothetical protein
MEVSPWLRVSEESRAMPLPWLLAGPENRGTTLMVGKELSRTDTMVQATTIRTIILDPERIAMP